jgi:hypothetical protein
MTIEKLRKRKDENIISGVEKKYESFFSSFRSPPSSPLSLFSFYQIKKKPNTHHPTSLFL